MRGEYAVYFITQDQRRVWRRAILLVELWEGNGEATITREAQEKLRIRQHIHESTSPQHNRLSFIRIPVDTVIFTL